MTTTMAKKHKKDSTPAAGQKDFIQDQETAEATTKAKRVDLVQYLQQHCMECRLEVSWFSTTKKIANNIMAEMLAAYTEKQKKAKEANGDDDTEDEEAPSTQAVGGHKRFFSSSHPAVKAANEAKRALEGYRNSMTAPVAKVPPLDMTEEQAAKFLTKEPGTRLIFTEQVDEFDTQCQVLIGNLKHAVKKLNESLEDIKTHDKQKLGRFFDEKDYPAEVKVEVRGPFYQEVGYSADFEKLAPAACARVKDLLYQRLSGTVDLAVNDFVKAFIDFATTMANQLGNRTRLVVPKGHPKYDVLRDAEVLAKVTPEQDEDVPEGHICVNVRLKPKKKGDKSVTDWITVTPAEYEALHPMTTEEKKIFRTTSYENLAEQCQTIKNLAGMLGDAGKPLVEAVEMVEDVVSSVGETPKEIEDELRNSGFARKKVASVLIQAATFLETNPVVQDIVKARHRRTIVRSKKAATADDEE